MAEVIRSDLPGPVTSDPVSKVVYVGPSISWRGIFAGAFVGLLVFFALGALGMGIAGASWNFKTGAPGVGLIVFGAIWMFGSFLLSLFTGGYVAGRASGVLPTRIGSIEGLVVSCMVILVVLTGLGTGIGTLTGMAGSALGSAASSAAVSSQGLQSVISESLGGLNLRSSPSIVAQGVVSRLASGNESSAVDYLAYQAGITRSDALQRIEQMKGSVAGTAREVGKAAASTTQAVGWTLFCSIVIGSLLAAFGGALGVRRNIRHPLSESDRRVAMEARPEWYGYAYGGPAAPEPSST